MKNIALISSIIFSLTAFSQSKKEQIQALVIKLDSTQSVLNNEREQFTSKINELEVTNQKQAVELGVKESEIKHLNQTILNIQSELDKSAKTIDELKNKIPAEAHFKLKVLKHAENQDGRFGSEDETEIYLMIQNQLIDTYSEFGTPELSSTNNKISIASEMSEMDYEIISINSKKVLVKRYFFCSDCEIQESKMEKIYQKNDSGIWKFISCSGDCED
jgi:chromosome segregation ATPase